MTWLIFISFFLVAFGQPAGIAGFGSLCAAFGYAFFWVALLSFSNPKQRFFLSLAWFSCVQAVQLSWMATTDYMGPLIIALYLFLITAMGVQFAFLTAFIRNPISYLNAFALAGFWVILEWLRLFFLCGFSWNPVGLALSDHPYSLQFASVWGIFGLSFWVILVNLVALKMALEKSWKIGSVWASLALFPYFFGWAQQTWVEATKGVTQNLRVALVQTALFPDQKEKIRQNSLAFVPPLAQWDRIIALLDPRAQIDLIVLPEAAVSMGAHRVGFELTDIKKFFKPEHMPPLVEPYALFLNGRWKVNHAFICQALANQFQAHVIVGLDDSDQTGSYNAAFHFQPNGFTHARYEKRILAPVGEYIPFRQWRKIAQFIQEQFGIYSSFDQGTEAKVFQAPLPIGVSICLEETFSHLIRELRLKGAQLFVNLTNDSWFPRSKLSKQHFDHGRVRAVENGVPVLRACNMGLTVGIDSFGQIVAQLPISEEQADCLYFKLPIRSYRTLYTQWGDAAILAISSIALLAYFVSNKKKLP